MSETKITMKLLIDGNKNKVVFAEAGKDCVDFLFNILSLPLGSVVKNLSKASMVGSLGNLYGSFESLGPNYLQMGLNKDCLLKPNPAAGAPSLQIPLFAAKPTPPANPAPKIFYACKNFRYYSDHSYVTDAEGPLSYITRAAKGPSLPGYVKGAVNYMIRDDLYIEPMSAISSVASSIALLNRFKVQDVGYLEEREVSVDMKKGLALLKASIKSETVLTDVFLLPNKAAAAAAASF